MRSLSHGGQPALSCEREYRRHTARPLRTVNYSPRCSCVDHPGRPRGPSVMRLACVTKCPEIARETPEIHIGPVRNTYQTQGFANLMLAPPSSAFPRRCPVLDGHHDAACGKGAHKVYTCNRESGLPPWPAERVHPRREPELDGRFARARARSRARGRVTLRRRSMSRMSSGGAN
jgi:hypothetical protein